METSVVLSRNKSTNLNQNRSYLSTNTATNSLLIKSRLSTLNDMNGKCESRITIAPHNKWTTIAKEKYMPVKSEVSYPKTLDIKNLSNTIAAPVEDHSV